MALYCLKVNGALPVAGFDVIVKIDDWMEHGYFISVEKVIKVSEHGDLIDRDALKDKLHYTDDFYETPFVDWDDILEAPAVIPAR